MPDDLTQRIRLAAVVIAAAALGVGTGVLILVGQRAGPGWAPWAVAALSCAVWLRWCSWYRGARPATLDIAFELVAVTASFAITTDARVASIVYAGMWVRACFLSGRALVASMLAYSAAILAGAGVSGAVQALSVDVLVHIPRMALASGALFAFTKVIGRQQALIAEQERLGAELTRQAFHDGLTGLPNRALFYRKVEEACARAGRSATPTAVMFVDLDDFKSVNDSLGHRAGDELLIEAAGRIRAGVRPQDTVARLGGDEFAVLLEDLPERAAAIAIAERIGELVQRPISIGGRVWTISASIGIAYAERQVAVADGLVRNADVAMYAAKNAGAGRHIVFDPALDAGVSSRWEEGDVPPTPRGRLRMVG